MLKLKVTKIAHFTGHKDAIFALGISDEPNLFYSGASDGYIVEWNSLTKADGQLLIKVPKPVYSFCLDTASQRLFCGTASGNLHVVDLAERKETRNIEAHTLGIFDIKIVNQHLITAGGDGKVKVWDLQQLQLQYEFALSDKSARVITVHPTRPEIAIGYSDHQIRIINTETFTLQHSFPAHQNSVFALAYSPDGNNLLSGGRDVMLRNWDIPNHYAMSLDIPAHNLHINAIAFNPSGDLMATVSMDKTLKIWDGTTLQLLKVAERAKGEGHLSSVNKVLWLNNTQLLTCSDDRTIMMWEITSAEG